MRDPHAVWNSLFKYYGRVTETLREFQIEHSLPHTADARPVSASTHMGDFLKGALQLPPRIREQGPQFAWPKHLRAWEDKLRAMREQHGQPVHIVDFDGAMGDPLSAVKSIMEVVQAAVGAGAAHPTGDGVVDMQAAEDIVQRTTYASVRELQVNRHGGKSLGVAVAAHFAADVSASWHLAFSTVTPNDRFCFESVTTRYRFIADNEQYRSSKFLLA
jgi:hypothetical protein